MSNLATSPLVKCGQHQVAAKNFQFCLLAFKSISKEIRLWSSQGSQGYGANSILAYSNSIIVVSG